MVDELFYKVVNDKIATESCKSRYVGSFRDFCSSLRHFCGHTESFMGFSPNLEFQKSPIKEVKYVAIDNLCLLWKYDTKWISFPALQDPRHRRYIDMRTTLSCQQVTRRCYVNQVGVLWNTLGQYCFGRTEDEMHSFQLHEINPFIQTSILWWRN